MADNWVSPTSYADPDSWWLNEASAYDGNIGTAASGLPEPNHYLILYRDVVCDKIRVYLQCAASPVSIDVYYGAAWHNVHSGAHASSAWVEHAIGSTEVVSAMRIAEITTYDGIDLYEAEFNDLLVEDGVSETFALSDTVAIAAAGAVSETISFTDSVTMDIVGQNLRVKICPKDPYQVSIAPVDPYVVELAPIEPYKVEIAPPEDA